jgi:hypothetical protein
MPAKDRDNPLRVELGGMSNSELLRLSRELPDVLRSLREARSIVEKMFPFTDSAAPNSLQATIDLIADLDVQTKELLKSRPVDLLARIRIAFIQDPYTVGAAIALPFIIFILYAFPSVAEYLRHLWALLSIGKDIISTAYADTAPPMTVPYKEVVQDAIILTIPVAFLASFATLLFSNKEDARRLAADAIKTILGFTIGVATNFFK